MDNRNAAPLYAGRRPRRRFVLSSTSMLASFGIIQGTARAAQFEFKCGSNFPFDHPASNRMRQIWSAVEHESGGRIRTRYFPNSELGGDAAMFSQLRLGAMQFFLIAPGNLSSVVPVFDISLLGFAYKDEDDGLRVIDGPLGAYLRQESAAKGLHTLRTVWNSGMFQLSSSAHPIRNPDDLRGFKVRVTESKITLDLFRNLGASPVAVSFNEVYMALQTKLVDGNSTPLVQVEASRFYEVQKYLSLTNHQWSPIWFIANGDVWKSLPPDLQELVERNCTKYALREQDDTKAVNASVGTKLAQQGMTINTVDQTAFRGRLGSYYSDWSRTLGGTAWSLLERSVGRKLA